MIYLFPCHVKNFFHHLYCLLKLIDRRPDSHTAALIAGWMRKNLKVAVICISTTKGSYRIETMGLRFYDEWIVIKLQ